MSAKNDNNKVPEDQDEGLLAKLRLKRALEGARENLDNIRQKPTIKRLENSVMSVVNSAPFKLITGTAVRRTSSLLMATVTIATLAGGWPFAVAAIGSIAAGVIIDTAAVQYTKRLYQQAKHLDRHREGLNSQRRILSQNPEIAHALKDELYRPKTEGKSKYERLSRNVSDDYRKKEGILRTIAYNTLASIVFLVEGISTHNPVRALGAIAGFAYGTYSATTEKITMSQKRNDFRNFIDKERSKPDSPAYNNSFDLKKAARVQKIQALALEKLANDTEIKGASQEQIKARFSQYKQQIEKKEFSVAYKNRFTFYAAQIVKSFFQANNPLSKYQDPEKMHNKSSERISGLAKHLDKKKTAETLSQQNTPESILQKKKQDIELEKGGTPKPTTTPQAKHMPHKPKARLKETKTPSK